MPAQTLRRATCPASSPFPGTVSRPPAETARLPPARSSPLSAPPSAKRVAQNDGLVSVRSGGDHVHRHAADRLQALQIGSRRPGQPVIGAQADGAFPPSRKLFVYRLAARGVFRPERQQLVERAVDAVAGAQPDLLHAV